MEAQQQIHVAMLPTPGMGHLIPLTQLAQKILQHHSTTTSLIIITFIIPSDGTPMKPQKALLKSLPNINTIFLPPLNFNDLPEDTKIETRVGLSVVRSLAYIREALEELNESTRLSAFMVDFFGTFSFEVVKDLGIPLYMFFPSPANILSLALHLDELNDSCTCEYRDLPEHVKFPGCYPIPGSDLADSVQDRKDPSYAIVVEMCKSYPLAKGILVNEFLDLEPNTYKAFEENEPFFLPLYSTNQDSRHGLSSQFISTNKQSSNNIPPVYPVGPLVRTGTSYVDQKEDKPECLKWLDEQPLGSVLYVSFGSGGTLSNEQLQELALGLEMSGQRFMWVVKTPHNKARSAAYFSSTEDENLTSSFLPDGFLERTKGKSFLLFDWAPQVEILSHVAVGGFITHCGWNSTMESIVHGVPLIAWPLFGEQKMNAVLLSEDLKVAFRVKENESGVVESKEIAKFVMQLFEGEEGLIIRNTMRDYKKLAGQALSESGSSTKSLAKAVAQWRAEV